MHINDSTAIKRKLDEATTKLAPGGERPAPATTIAVKLTYGEMMIIWDAIALCELINRFSK